MEILADCTSGGGNVGSTVMVLETWTGEGDIISGGIWLAGVLETLTDRREMVMMIMAVAV